MYIDKESPYNADETFSFSNNLAFLEHEVDTKHGIIERIKTTIEKHWGETIPIVHFTNSEASWGKGAPLKSTGVVESIKEKGFRPYTNFGYVPGENSGFDLEEWYRDRGRDINLDHITLETAKNSSRLYIEALDRLRREFVHHGLRVNKNNVNGIV